MHSRYDPHESNKLMKDLPLVSIVTPAYNQAEYLAATIVSVLAQDYPNLEYIVLDDGSTDDTPAILKQFDGRIRHERHTNMGQARTLNRGWEMARGSLIGYLSSDDCLAPQAVSRLVQAMVERPDVIVAYCDFELIDAKGRVFREVRTEDYDQKRLCVDLVCQPGPGALFRRELFDCTGGWMEHLRQVPDFEFWLRASRMGQFLRVPELLAHYRVHEGSASFSVITAERSTEIVNIVFEYWSEQPGLLARQALASAHLIAAKNHIQSGRMIASLMQLGCSARYRPIIFFSLAAWKILLSGVLRRTVYNIWRR